LQVLGIVLAVIVVTVIATGFVLRTYIFPREFKPVTLNSKEEHVLNAKLERLDPLRTAGTRSTRSQTHGERRTRDALEPERYTEEDASRQIVLAEKELNALLAKNTDLARKLAIDLSDNLVSAKLLVPVDEDFPILGGHVLKVRAGMELAYEAGKPIVVLRGVSVMGVPIPNAWLGGIKNIDLVKEFGAEEGFWTAFAAGVEDIRVAEGSLRIQLKE
jgi:hypothetical protein